MDTSRAALLALSHLAMPLPLFLCLSLSRSPSLSLSHVRGAFSLITRHENLMAYNQCRIQGNLQVAPPPFSPPSRTATASSCVKQQLPIPLPLSLHSPSHIRITYANLFILFILCHHVPPTCPLPFALSAAAPSVPALLLSPCPSSTSSSLFFRLSSSVSMCELWPFVCCFCHSFVCLFACLCVVCLPRMLTHSHTHTLSLPLFLSLTPFLPTPFLWLSVCLALETKATPRGIAALSNCRF